MTPFVLATANPDKAAEITEILGGTVELVGRPESVPEVAETGSSLEENARLKARSIADATGHPAIADDTGLEVDALGGGPGVYSARYAGESAGYADNVAKLLVQLEGVAEPRRARFRTVAIAVWPDGSERLAEGSLDGSIALGARGYGGFGYDPVFVPDGGDGRSLAEMSASEKNQVSHRGRALRALAEMLRAQV